MVQVWFIAVVALLPVPTVVPVVSQVGQRCFAEMATGLMVPRTVVSELLVYCVVHLAQAIAGAAATGSAATGWDISNCAPLTWAEVFAGDQTAKAAAKARLVPMRELRILVFIFFIFVCFSESVIRRSGLLTRAVMKSHGFILANANPFLSWLPQ